MAEEYSVPQESILPVADNLEIEIEGNSRVGFIDPAWDYSEIYEMLLDAQGQLSITLAAIGRQECATLQSQANLGMRLECLATTLLVAQEILQKIEKNN